MRSGSTFVRLDYHTHRHHSALVDSFYHCRNACPGLPGCIHCWARVHKHRIDVMAADGGFAAGGDGRRESEKRQGHNTCRDEGVDCS